MNVLVYAGDIAGTTDTPESLPDGFQCFRFDPDVSLDTLFFDGQQVLQKPPKSNHDAVWRDNQWVIPDMVQAPASEPAFSQTDIFQQARVAGRESLAVQMEFTVAVYADAQGNKRLLEDAKQQLTKAIKTHEEQKKKAASTSSVTTGVKL